MQYLDPHHKLSYLLIATNSSHILPPHGLLFVEYVKRARAYYIGRSSVSAWARGWGRPPHQIGKQSSLNWTGTGQTSNQLKRIQDIMPKEPGAFKDANKNRLRDTG